MNNQSQLRKVVGAINAVIISAGKSLDLHHSDYRFLYLFAKQLRMMNINARIVWKTARNPMSLYHLISEFANPPEFLFIIDQMEEEDIAKTLIGDWLSIPLVMVEDALEKVQQHCREKKIPITATMEQYAKIPQDAIVVKNPLGIAPGFIVYTRSQYIVVLPHKPAELSPLMDNCIVPMIAELTERKISTKVCHAIGIEMEVLETRLADILRHKKICYQCNPTEFDIEVGLFAYDTSQKMADKMVETCVQTVLEELQPFVCGDDRHGLAKQFADFVVNKSLTISAADRLNGKQAMARVKQNAPELFQYIVNANFTDVMRKALGVPEHWIKHRKGVNEKAAMHMAHGIQIIDNTQIGLSAICSKEGDAIAIGIASKDCVSGRLIELPSGDFPAEAVENWIQTHILNYFLWTLAPFPKLRGSIPIKELYTDEEKEFSRLIHQIAAAVERHAPLIKAVWDKWKIRPNKLKKPE